MDHPLNAADAARSEARVADIELGLAGPEEDRWFWREKLARRIKALEEDSEDYGLCPHEERELERLRALKAKADPEIPSEAEIEAASSAAGGWDRKTLARWGVAWPPPKGWKAELLAKSQSRHEAGDRRREGYASLSSPHSKGDQACR